MEDEEEEKNSETSDESSGFLTVEVDNANTKKTKG